MTFTLMDLPYSENALEPFMSAETVSYHYGKHHAGYVKKLNSLIENTQFQDMGLAEIITDGEQGEVYNNAAQIWNHDLFWTSLQSDNGGVKPDDILGAMIDASFGSFEIFQQEFKKEALSRFGSGWVWLVQFGSKLEIYSSENAHCPLTIGGNALLGCDVWEHAYYLDTRNDRGKYIDNFWNIVNWEHVGERLDPVES